MPHDELWNIVTPTVDPENAAAALEAKQGLLDFERRLAGVIAERRAKEALQPPPWVPDPDDLWGSANVPSMEDPTHDHQKYGW